MGKPILTLSEVNTLEKLKENIHEQLTEIEERIEESKEYYNLLVIEVQEAEVITSLIDYVEEINNGKETE